MKILLQVARANGKVTGKRVAAAKHLSRGPLCYDLLIRKGNRVDLHLSLQPTQQDPETTQMGRFCATSYQPFARITPRYFGSLKLQPQICFSYIFI